MFRLCTSLTHAPDLPAETLATNCYNGMFRSCNNLVHLRCYINVHDGSANHEKANYDRNAMKSNLDKWLDGVPSSNATILCHPDMVEYWDHARQNVTDWYSDYTFTSIGRYWTVNEWTTYPN